MPNEQPSIDNLTLLLAEAKLSEILTNKALQVLNAENDLTTEQQEYWKLRVQSLVDTGNNNCQTIMSITSGYQAMIAKLN